MKKRISKPFLIGLFTVAVLGGAYFGINFLKSRRIFSDDRIMYTVFPRADGLEVSAPVLVNGFKIGTVDKVSFDMETSEVLVKLIVDGQYDLPATSVVEIASTSLLGGKALVLTLGKKDDHYLASGDTIKSVYAPGLTESLGQEYGKLKATATEIVDKLNLALDGLNRTLSQENTEALTTTLANIEQMSSDLSEVTGSQKTNLKELIANLSSLSKSLAEMMPQIDRGVDNLATLTDTLKTQGPELIHSLVGSITNLNMILAKANSDQGTVGKLINDEALYQHINTTVVSLNALLEDIKENPKRYINVSVFGSKEKKEKPKN